jgi:hypothetical protein
MTIPGENVGNNLIQFKLVTSYKIFRFTQSDTRVKEETERCVVRFTQISLSSLKALGQEEYDPSPTMA